MTEELAAPNIVDRAMFQAESDALRGSRQGLHERKRRDCSRLPTAPHGSGGRRHTALIAP